MKIQIKIPPMGESITDATIGELLKPSGQLVKVDDEILELETDKVNQVLYAPESGLLTWQVETGQTVKIGETIGFVDTEAAEKKEEKKTQEPKKETPKEPTPEKPVERKEPVAVEEGIRKTKDDVAAKIQSKPAFPQPPLIKTQKKTPEKSAERTTETTSQRGESRTPMTRIRKVIAQRLLEAQRSTAMLTTFNEADLSAVMELRNRHRETFQQKYGVKLGFMSFFVKATVLALQAVPELNSYIDGEEIVHREYFDIGIAVGTERGLVVPVVRNCDRLSFAEIETAIAQYAEKARKGELSLDDLQGGGFTITNGGIYGSLLSTPIINPPQSGILGMHKIEKRAVVIEDQIVIRPMMYLALSYDHRIVDGKEAVTFLVRVKECIEDPARILCEV